MPSTEDQLIAFSVSIGAGLATTIGAAAVFTTKRANTKLLGIGMAAAAGVMIFVSFVEVLAEGTERIWAGFDHDEDMEGVADLISYSIFFFGALIIAALDWMIHKFLTYEHTHDVNFVYKKSPVGEVTADPLFVIDPEGGPHAPDHGDADDNNSLSTDVEIADDPDVMKMKKKKKKKHQKKGKKCPHAATCTVDVESGLYAEGDQSACEKSDDNCSVEADDSDSGGSHGSDEDEDSASEELELKKTGIVTAVALALHNFPEGLATYIATLENPAIGISLGIAIAVHNIPEGMCVSIPIYYATGSKWKGFFWGFFSGLSEPLGALAGFAITSVIFNDWVMGFLFSLTAGMMMFISFRELLPTARQYDPEDKWTTISLYAGMAVMAASLVLFKVSF